VVSFPAKIMYEGQARKGRCMKKYKIFGMAAAAALVLTAGCKKARPILPKSPLPPGTFQIQFTSKVSGPLELALNGVRIPVEQKKKKAKRLTISGLSQGVHRYFIASLVDVIGPDVGEVEIGPDAGVFQVHFSQRLKIVAYDLAQTAVPKPDGLPGVKAVLE